MELKARTLKKELIVERSSLTPIGSSSSGSRGRIHKESTTKDCRTCYQQDRDRIIHSTAFRRLQHKTQVFLYHEGDFYRTRLTHSLAVAQIGQTIARFLGANQDLVEAISLAHDVGHPPFGHAGEDVLREMMKPVEGFDHNLQALRVVEELKMGPNDLCGLNLTWETREGIARHTSFFDAPPVCEDFNSPQPGIEAQITNIADIIAYATHDMEDAIEARLLKEDDFASEPLWNRVCGCTHLSNGHGPRRVLRTKIHKMADILVEDVVKHTLRNLRSKNIKTTDDIRSSTQSFVTFSPDVEEEVKRLVDVLVKHVYKDPRVVRMDTNAKRMLKALFNEFIENRKLLPFDTQQKINESTTLLRVVCDYISGMTDRHAIELYKSIFDPDGRSLVMYS